MSANEEIGNSRQPQSEKTNKPGAMIGGAILGASLGGMPGALIGSVVGGVLGIILDDDSEGGSQ